MKQPKKITDYLNAKKGPIAEYTSYNSREQELASEIFDAEELIEIYDSLMMESYNEQIQPDNFYRIIRSFIENAEQTINQLNHTLRIVNSKEIEEDFNRGYDVLAKLASRLRQVPSSFEDAKNLGLIIIIKDKMKTLLKLDDIETKIFELNEEHDSKKLDDSTFARSILAVIKQSDQSLFDALTPAIEAKNIILSRESIKEEVRKSIERSSKDDLRLSLEVLERITTDDEEFFFLLDRLENLLRRNEQIKKEIEENFIIEEDTVGIVMTDDSSILESATLVREEPNLKFSSLEDLETLESLKKKRRAEVIKTGILTLINLSYIPVIMYLPDIDLIKLLGIGCLTLNTIATMTSLVNLHFAHDDVKKFKNKPKN